MSQLPVRPPLVGRSAEQARLDELLADAAAGRSRALVLRGEAGIGKTTLLGHLAATADGFRVLRATGVQSEAEIPFAGLQVLLAPVADRVDGLPPAQAGALRAALGASAEPGDALLVRAATLTLLSVLAEDRPLLCLLDDAHLIDQASAAALLFAVRRMHDDPVGVVLAARDGDRPFPAEGIESLTVPRMDRAGAVDLLGTVGALAPTVVDRILQDSRGNPLAVLELAAEPAHGITGDPDPVTPLPAAGRLEQHFRARLAGLPSGTRTAVLLLAADPGLRLTEFAAAAAHLGVTVADLEPAELQGLVAVVADEPVFRHPLVRAAAYQGQPLARRLAAHGALAAALRGAQDADRRAWHRAAAVVGVDDDAAAELDAAAERGRDRGAPAAASRAWARAAELSGSDDARGRRLVEAARSAYDAGELDRADGLAAAGMGLTPDAGERAEAGWVRAQVAYERESPSRAAELALDAAAPIVGIDPVRGAGLITEATWCARDAGDPALLRRCRDLLSVERQPGVAGFVALLEGDLAGAVPAARELVTATLAGRIDDTAQRFLGAFLAVLLGDDATAVAMLEEHVTELRRAGALGWLPYGQEVLALAHVAAGGPADAAIAVADGIELARELGQQLQVVVLTAIGAWLSAVGGAPGREQQVALVLREHRGHRLAVAFAHWADAVADLAAGRPAEALPRLERVLDGTARFDVPRRAIADHVEAAVRVGDPERARRHLPVLRDWAAATGSPAARALDLRCAALLDGSRQAAGLFEEALAGSGPYDRARTLLSYGEWLRRNRRPGAARDRLVAAHETFLRIGALGWTPRVEAELRALGASAPAPATAPPTGPLALTPQELQVARLAAQGLTNREIAAHLFLSPRTVGHHLYKAYPKLGIARRAELGQLQL